MLFYIISSSPFVASILLLPVMYVCVCVSKRHRPLLAFHSVFPKVAKPHRTSSHCDRNDEVDALNEEQSARSNIVEAAIVVVSVSFGISGLFIGCK